MPDVLTPTQRHRCMSHIRSKATKPEILVRKWLWAHGYRYRLNVKSVPGKPDIVMRKYRTAIFVNGCFWHGHEGCKQFVLPKTNTAFWQAKIERNRERDKQNEEILRANGWQVITLWACMLEKEKMETTMQSVAVALNRNLLRVINQHRILDKSNRHSLNKIKNMNILITGCKGQLGTEMRNLSAGHKQHRYFFTDVVGTDNDDVQKLDITNREAVRDFVVSNHIDLIVNCAAYTNVDKAEEDEDTARLINALAVENLGVAGAKVIHISTDYVFSGDESEPCLESDAVAPRTAYGRTKLEGERLLLSVNPDAVIIRTAWLYSPYGNNFVKTMLRLGKERDELRVVNDQIGTPTYAEDLAKAIYAVIEAPEWHAGIYHFTDEGVCSWYDFTVEILRQAGITCRVVPIRSEEYAYKTPRPKYSVLDKTKIKETFNIHIPEWQDSLAKCLARL